MARSFWDTNAIVKLFLRERGSAGLEVRFNEAKRPIIVSNLTSVEFTSVMHRQFRKKLLAEQEIDDAIAQVRGYVQARKFVVYRNKRAHFDVAEELINKYGKARELQTLDALQLASALELQVRELLLEFVTSDHGLLSLGRELGLPVVDPETL